MFLNSCGTVPLCIFDNSCGGSTPAPVVLGATGQPNLTITKTVNPTLANPGDTVGFTVTVTNNGNLTAFNTTLEDSLPEDLTYQDSSFSVSPANINGQSRSWAVGDLTPGGKFIVSYRAAISDKAEPKNYLSPAAASADNNPKIETRADLKVEKVAVLGAELPATGFSFAELSQLIIVFSLTLGLAQILRRKEEVLVAD